MRSQPDQAADASTSAQVRAERIVPVLMALFEHCVEALGQDQGDGDSDEEALQTGQRQLSDQ